MGEAESAKALGIVINQNTQEYKDSVKYYTEVEGKTLLQAKAFTALKMATEQSGNAIGDVARTWESHANVQRRLEESTKSLREELGKQVNEGLTPLLSLTDKIVRKMAEWAKEQNKVHDAIKNFENGVADGKESVIALNEQLRDQILQMESLRKAQGYNIQGTKDAIKYQEEQIEQTKIALALAQQKAQSEALDAKYNEENAKAAAVKAEKEKQAREQAKKDLENLEAAFSSTREGQIEALKSSIAYFESFKQGPMASAVLEDLYSQLEELQGKQEELTETTQVFLGDAIVPLSDAEAEMWQNYGEHIAGAIEETQDMEEEVKELNQIYQDLANEGIGAFAVAFKDIGSGNKDLWEGFKDAGKDAISAILEGLAKMALAQAALDLAALNFVGAAAYTTAAAGAYAASGFVQTLATGGSFTTTGPTPILVGDNTSGQERITVEPVGGDNGGNQTMILNIDGQQFMGWMQNSIDNGRLRIPKRVLV